MSCETEQPVLVEEELDRIDRIRGLWSKVHKVIRKAAAELRRLRGELADVAAFDLTVQTKNASLARQVQLLTQQRDALHQQLNPRSAQGSTGPRMAWPEPTNEPYEFGGKIMSDLDTFPRDKYQTYPDNTVTPIGLHRDRLAADILLVLLPDATLASQIDHAPEVAVHLADDLIAQLAKGNEKSDGN